MNIEKIENRFNKLPNLIQIILMVSFYPLLCTLGLITLSGWFIVLDFLLRIQKMTIYEIKEKTKVTAPNFFCRDTMKFFDQTLKDFKVKKQSDGRFKISAPSGKFETIRFFNPENNKFEMK